MASVTLNESERWAPGLTIGAYLSSNWATWQLPPSGTAVGAAATTAVVSATGTLAFTGLADSTSYYAAKSDGVGGYVKFSTPKAASSAGAAAAVSTEFVYGGGEVVATRPGLAASTAFSAGTSLWVSNLQSVHVTLRAVTTIRLFYRNAHHETNNTNNLTLKAQISVGSLGAGPFFPVFFNGSRSILLEPGASILSDPVTVDLASGTTFYCHTQQTAGTSQVGEKYIINHNAFLTGEFGNNTVSDQTGVQLTTGAVGGMVPTAIVAGKPATTPKAMVGVFGDSMLDGKLDSNQEGWAARALKGTYGYIGGALSSESLNSFINAANSYKRRQLMDGITAAVTNYGINDVSVPRTLAQIQADLTTGVAIMRRAGATKVTWATLLPLTTSTDAWVTTANQTVGANEAGRVAFNDWLRTQAGVAVDYVFDAADVVETDAAGVATRNGGRWGATYASAPAGSGAPDGVHPTIAGHAALTTAFQAFIVANVALVGV